MTSKPVVPHNCPTCFKRMRFGYPGNDPENGSAQWLCRNGACQRVAEDAEMIRLYYLMSPDEAHHIALEDEAEARRLEEMYPADADVCGNCGGTGREGT